MAGSRTQKAAATPDRYYTPGWCVDQALDHVLPIVCPRPRSILEPGAGRGVFIAGLRTRFRGALIHALDIDEAMVPWPDADVSVHADFINSDLETGSGLRRHYDLVIGNPPYSRALEFIRRALVLGGAVVFLLRQGFLASQTRAQFFRDSAPSHVFIMPNRPSFILNRSNDKTDYAWVCWGGAKMKCSRASTTMASADLIWLPDVPVGRRVSDRRT